MRKIILILLFSAFLAGCGVDEDPKTKPIPQAVIIPLPTDKTTLEPSVAFLLNKTASEVHQAMDDPKKWMVHGSALFANAYYNEASEALAHAIAINSEMPQATYLLATALWKANRQEKAIQALETSLVLIPEYDMGWRLLAEWHLDRGESLQAETSARRAFALAPQRIGTRYILGQSLMDQGKHEEALQLIEQVTVAENAPRWIYTLANQCYRQLGMDDKAEKALAKSGTPLIDWPDPMFNHIPNFIAGKAELALYALHVHRTIGSEKAMPFLQKALQINPEHVDVRVALSIALQNKGLLDQAQKILEESQGEPNSNYWKQLAGLSIAKKDLNKASEHIQNALELDPESANALDIAAVIASEQGNTQEASTLWEKAGILYVESKNWDKAELSLAFASENGELRIEGLSALALAQIELKHFLQARISINKVLKKDPSNSIAQALESRLPQE